MLIYAYANNHYAGHAPATIAKFIELWSEKELPELARPLTVRQQTSLFGA